MSECDWSSDVCSSDLNHTHTHTHKHTHTRTHTYTHTNTHTHTHTRTHTLTRTHTIHKHTHTHTHTHTLSHGHTPYTLVQGMHVQHQEGQQPCLEVQAGIQHRPDHHRANRKEKKDKKPRAGGEDVFRLLQLFKVSSESQLHAKALSRQTAKEFLIKVGGQ